MPRKQNVSSIRELIAMLRDPDQAPSKRWMAMQALKSAAFDPVAFAPHRSSYMGALRALRTDADMKLRKEAIGVLACERDPDTQQLLVQGLDSPDDALLAPQHALQMLCSDPHSGAQAAARRIADNPPSLQARREALRVLASDPASVPMFEKILRDRDEKPPIRQLAASALQHLEPKRLHQCARELAMDKNESDQIKTLGMTVLATYAGDDVLEDKKLKSHVASLNKRAGKRASQVAVAARKLSERYT